MSLLDTMSMMDTFCSGIENRRSNVMPELFDEMGGQDQFVHMVYYFLDKQGKFRRDRANDLRAALNDHLDPHEVFRAFRSSDCAKLLQLVTAAMEKGLAKAIDRENAKGEAE